MTLWGVTIATTLNSAVKKHSVCNATGATRKTMSTYKSTITTHLPIWLVLLASLLALTVSASAETVSPWKLAFSLQDASLNTALPTALHIDETKKRYYVVLCNTGQLASFDHQGKFLKIFTPEDGLDVPFDMVRPNATTLIIAEKGPNSLTTIDFSVKKTTRTTIATAGQDMVVDRLEMAGDTLYSLDKATGQIYRLNPDLSIAQRFPLPKQSKGLVDFKIVGKQIWALGQQEQQIYVYTENGRISKQVDLTPFVKFPVSIAVDKNGSIYVLDRHLGQVIVLDRKHKLKYTFLGKGHGTNNLYFPMEIRFDPWGRLCIVDEGNSRVQVFQR